MSPKSPNKISCVGSTVREEFHFEPPPEAPVFRPTAEEFSDPLAYITKIRDEAEKYGLCKIIPPEEWQPPFAVDVDKFKFTPRIQRLNELEANTRIKLNFLDQIAKFWELQGSSLKIPMVERRTLDLHQLHFTVETEGGFHAVNTARKWAKIGARMGLPTSKDLGNTLRIHYERILYPYDVFKDGEILSDVKSETDSDPSSSVGKKRGEKAYKPHGIVSRQAIKPPEEKYARRSTRADKLKSKGSETNVKEEIGRERKSREVKKEAGFVYDPLAKYVCLMCDRGDAEEQMLLCDGCDDSIHTFCLVPPLTEIPKGDWRCPRCVAAVVSKPMEAFGFEQARREYTLQQFGDMADQFKASYFEMPVHLVPPEAIEREFWRIMSCIDEDVTVEYGADLHTMDHGSGFPTSQNSCENIGDAEYAKCGWNLNNLPNLDNSILGYINVDISGMKVPWMYVGMCFATFCWHNEDHWSYSINYLHWGEPKTWYGVPGSKADLFEESMRTAAPQLFASQPDLLHQLVTIMNPNILTEAGVPVYRTDQKTGEFVITFPRAYHAGFNQGYNFAEAVNFATLDWLKKGRQCIDHYSSLRRYCVFSHDELVCKMASTPNILDLTVAKATYEDMAVMVETETKLRKQLLEWGVTEAEREAFELLPDDERQCETCKTTCFLSAVTCSCTSEQLVCLRHCMDLCKCGPEKHKLRYRYTLDELPAMLDALRLRAECYDEWCDQVKSCLDPAAEKTRTLSDVKALLTQALDSSFPSTELLKSLQTAIDDAEKCLGVAQQIVNKKLRTRTRQTAESKYKLTVEELILFFEEIESLCCVIKERDDIKDLLDKVQEWQLKAKPLLEIRDLDSIDSDTLEKCIDAGSILDIELPEMPQLKQNVQRVGWLENVIEMREDESLVTLDALRTHLSSGVELPPHPLIERQMAQLQQLLMNVEKWEEKAKDCLATKQHHPITVVEALITEAEDIPAYLPSEHALKDALKKAKEWTAKVESFESYSDSEQPYLETLEQLVLKGRFIPIYLELLPLFETKLDSAKQWKERTARTFLRKNSRYTLMEALSPRGEIGMFALKMKKKKALDDGTGPAPVVFGTTLEGNISTTTVVAAFKAAEREEMATMRDLRMMNLRKRATDKGDSKYCVCRRGANGIMFQCELCKDWFHASCVPLPKNAGAKAKQSPAQQLATRDVKFLCPCCLRSRRPRLETILSLLMSLQKLEVRVPEGEALQCLTERAMNWQDRARTSLGTEEIASALAKLSVLSQKLTEAAAREKTEKIITSELKKAADKIGNPEHHRRVRAMSGVSSADDSLSGSLPSGWLKMEGSDSNPQGFQLDGQEVKIENDENGTYFSGNREHAYSTASKTPLIKQPKLPQLAISDVARAELDELMLEGDLLEVSLDETTHIWRILQATKPKLETERQIVEESNDCSPLFSNKHGREKFKAKQRIRENHEQRKRRFDDFEWTKQILRGKKLKPKSSYSPPTPPPPPPPPPPRIYHETLPGPSTSNLSQHQKKQKKMPLKPSKETPKKKMGKRRSHEVDKKSVVRRKKRTVERDETSSESDSSEDCAAKTCMKPVGKEVDWVQCDGGCEKWFHFACMNITKSDIREDEDFICDVCGARPKETHRSSRHALHTRTSYASPPRHSLPQTSFSRVKVEPTDLHLAGVQGLLKLSTSGLQVSDSNAGLDNQNSGWGQQNYSYDIEEPRAYHHGMPQIPSRATLNIAQPLQNSPEMLLNSNSNMTNYTMQDQYPQMEQHTNAHAHYPMQEVLSPYGPQENQFGPPQYQAPAPSFQHQNYAPPPPAYQYPTYPEQFHDAYVLTQLTEPSKPNYAVQTFPSYPQQPEFPLMFPDDRVKGAEEQKVVAVSQEPLNQPPPAQD